MAGIVAGAAFFAASPAWAAFGDVDTTFGSTAAPGYAIHDLGGDSDLGIDLVTGIGDRLYALGAACNAANCLAVNQIKLTRYSADGDVDATFGNAGDLIVATNVSDADYRIEVADADGKIYLSTVGCNPPSVCAVTVKRIDFQGNVDSSYGTSGVVTIPTTPNNPSVVQLLLQNNGKLLVLLEHDDRDNTNALTGTRFNIVRLNTDGTPDSNWGTDGSIDVSTPSGCDLGASMMLGRAPVIYVTAAKLSNCTATPTPVVRRFNFDGTLDGNFGSAGQVTGTFGQSANDVVALVAQEQPDGKIGYGIGNINGQGALTIDVLRLNNDGSLDTSFTPEHGSFVPLANFLPNGNAQFQSTGKLVFNGVFQSSPTNADESLVRMQGSPLFAHPPRFAPFVRFDQVSDSVNENVGTTTIKVELCANSGPTCLPVTTAQPITIPFTIGGDATPGADYTIASTSVTIPAGASSANIVVNIIDDTEQEFGETILFTLGDAPGAQSVPGNSSFILGIVDNDLTPSQVPSADNGGALGADLLAGLFGLLGLRRARARRR